MELLILCLCILLIRPRTRKWKPYEYQAGMWIEKIDETDRRVMRHLDSAQWLLDEAERLQDPELVEFAKEERDKAEKLIEEFKLKNGI